MNLNNFYRKPLGNFPYLLKFLKRVRCGYAILMYHSVSGETDFEYDMDKERFKDLMEYLKQNFKITSLEEIVEKLKSGEKNENFEIAITFDDGYKNNYDFVYPLLNKMSIPASFFITTEFIESGENNNIGNNLDPMTWEEIKKISSNDLFSIGSHGKTHRVLTELKKEEIIDELKGSKEILEEKLEKEIIFFSYPNGRYNQKVADLVEDAGYKVGLCSEKRINNIKSNLFELGRIAVTKKSPTYL